MKVYLDNAATTRLDPRVFEAMRPYFTDDYGNPSSAHSLGKSARKAVEESRETIAKSLSAKPSEIIFTSGGTESDNLALKGVAWANRGKGRHIVTSKVEHDAVLNTCKWLEENGFKVTYVDVDDYGVTQPEALEKALRKDTVLASVIHGNNEIGTINNIKALAEVCHSKGVLFHTDACQSYTKTLLDAEKQGLDLVTVNGHKIHGPKGVGALYVREGVKIQPTQHGGGHEKNLRSGTLNVPGIVGFAKAVEVADPRDVERMARLRDKLVKSLLQVPGCWLNGHPTERLCNNASISFRYLEGEKLLAGLFERGVEASAGSACLNHSPTPSHVIKEVGFRLLIKMGVKPEEPRGTVRFSLSKYTTEEEIDYALGRVREAVDYLRK